MQNQPSTLRFSLRAMFIWTAFVALGLAALKYPFAWVAFVVDLAIGFSVVFALVSALASMDSGRLFWAAYAASVPVIFFISPINITTSFLPPEWVNILAETIHPTDIQLERVAFDFLEVDAARNFLLIANRLSAVMFSAVAAYIIPWLVQRGKKPPHA
jgi:hypothetical protein